MQSGEDQMARFRRFQPDFDRFLIAHFPDQDHLGGLPQGRAQRQSEARRVAVEFALMNRGFLVEVQKLDRVFDGEDVVGLLLIDFVQDSGQRRGFSGPGRARHQDDAIAQFRDFAQLRRQVERLEIRNRHWE